MEDVEIFSDSLSALYEHTAITLSSNPGSNFSYTNESTTVNLKTPDTKPENWSLHASSIWISAVFFADHIHCLLDLDRYQHLRKIRVLELGAGAGLPGILLAKTRDDVQVVLSDYPDEELIDALNQNVASNISGTSVHVVPYDWTTGDVAPFHALSPDGFDVIIAADTLWSADLHDAFLRSLESLLRHNVDGPSSSVNLIAGLHTGRWTIQAFLNAVEDRQRFRLHRVMEIPANSSKETASEERSWEVEREGEDESGRRAWVVSITMGWR